MELESRGFVNMELESRGLFNDAGKNVCISPWKPML